MKFTTKPIEIEAFPIIAVGPDAGGDGKSHAIDLGTEPEPQRIWVDPAQFGMHVPQVGDYWIMGDNGDHYLCPKDVFEMKYAPSDPSKLQQFVAGLKF